MNIQTSTAIRRGHNENAVRLGILADEARRALGRVASGETDAIEGWLAYGASLNEGRALFPSDEQFGQWVDASVNDKLSVTPNLHERAAAMWASANCDQFEEARATGNARTVRGIHSKWKEIEAEREAAAQRLVAEAARKEAQAHAEAEALARLAAQEAEDEEARRVAHGMAEHEAEARQEAEALALEADKKAKKADKAVKKSRNDNGGDNKTAHVSNNSGENEWYTPAVIIEAARRVLGGFDLDPASSEIANRTVKAERFFTIEDDGLTQDWAGKIWCNPPYSQPLINEFCLKFAGAMSGGSTGIALVNNATETAWFQTLARSASAICFPASRIKFNDPSGAPSGSPLQGQAIIYSGAETGKFMAEFSKIGFVSDWRGRVEQEIERVSVNLLASGEREILDAAKQIRADRALKSREDRIVRIDEISRGNAELGTSIRYPVIYADPPWRYENPPMGGTNRSIENHYPTMTLDEICALPVSDLATEDALLYLWATAPKLAECMKVIEAWGFEYRTNIVWDKMKIGMGYHARNQHELLLIAKRGEIPPPPVGKQPASVIRIPRGKHSAKPEEFHEIIERAYPELSKIELFSRSPREGWASYGNEVPGGFQEATFK